MINNETITKLLESLVKDLVQEKYKEIINTERGGNQKRNRKLPWTFNDASY